MKITKKQNNSFIELMKKELIKMGAVPFISDELQFDLKTKFGVLWLTIDYDNESCYSIYGRFVDTSNLPDSDLVNSWSGKFNHHITGQCGEVVEQIKNSINYVVNLKSC